MAQVNSLVEENKYIKARFTVPLRYMQEIKALEQVVVISKLYFKFEYRNILCFTTHFI